MIQINIDMPDTCHDCAFAGYDLSLIDVRWCPFLRKQCTKGSRLNDCPLREVPKGKWIDTVEGTYCSNCNGYPYDDGEYHIKGWSSDFCPNCGARMKEGDK